MPKKSEHTLLEEIILNEVRMGGRATINVTLWLLQAKIIQGLRNKVCLSDLGWLLFSDGGTLWPLPRIQVGKLFKISTKSMFQLTLGS